MTECIYCRATADAVRFTRPEHVVPKAFGRFEANLTIFSVCEECNQWFGNNLEVSFTRNSGEALMRLLFGAKPPKEATDSCGHRIDMAAGDGARFAGVETYFKPRPDGTQVVASFVPQVGVATSEHAEPVLFREADLTPDIVSRYAGFEVLVLAETEDDFQRLMAKLSEMGCQAETVLWWHPDTSLPLVLEPVVVDYRLDEGVFRTIGKIACNYLAHVAGADFCLSHDFDGFRRYVRYGEGEWQAFISLSNKPLLSDERRAGTRLTRGHLLVAEWTRTSDVPMVSVKLFNDILYRVRFAARVSMLWRELRAGHHFNFKSRKIQPITIVDLVAP